MKKIIFILIIILIGTIGATTTITDTNINTTGNVTGEYILGDGSLLSGIISYILKWTTGNFIGSLYTTGANSSGSDSNSIFQIIGSDGTPRFQVQNGGDNQASFIARSFMVVNQNNTRLNQSQNNLCSDWGFQYIDCNSSTTGADMGVQDDFEVQGLTYTREGIYGDTSKWGVYLLLSNLSNYITGGNNGTFTDSTDIFCDYVLSPFTEAQVANEKWIQIRSGEYEGAVAEINAFINSSCVSVKNNPSWVLDLTNQVFILGAMPVFIITDGGFGEFYVGEDPRSKFEIKIRNGTGDHGFEVSGVAGVDQFMTSRIYTDMKTYKGVTGLESIIDASVLTGQTNSNNIILELISTNFQAGLHTFMKAAIIGIKSNNLVVNLFELSGNFSTYITHGSPDVISKIYYDNGNGTNVDITNAITNSSNNIALFENDNSIIYLGSTVNFTRFSVSLETTASRDLGFELYYCNTTGDWPQRTGITDTTNGFRFSGLISVEQSSPDRGICNFDMSGTPFTNTTNYTYVALKRTTNYVVRNSVEKISSISGSSATFILADDYMKLNPVDISPVTCDATNLGSIYFDISVDDMCVCKSGGWFVMKDGSACT